MKILVISDIPPFVTGGAEMQALRLINAWMADGHEIRCIGRNLPEKKISANYGPLTLHSIPMIRHKGRALRALSYFFSLAKFVLLNKTWPDIIYTRFLGDAAVTISLLKRLKLLNCVVISTPANAGEKGDVHYIRSAPAGTLWLSLINSQCNAINLIAPQMVDDLKQANITRPIITQIPNGIPIQIHPSVETKNTIPSFVSVGRLSHQKGYDIFLEAIYRLKKSSHSFHVTIIGDGPERDNLNQQIIQYEIQSYVTLLGELNQDEIRTQLDCANIFVLSSRYEGMANAALEAMAAGKPVVLTRCGGLDFYITDTMGWIAETESADSLHDCLLAALKTDNDSLQQMGLRNKKFVSENFEMTYVANQYIELFKKLIKQK